MRKSTPGLSREYFRFVGEGDRKGKELQAGALAGLKQTLQFKVSAPVKRVGKFYGVWMREAVCSHSNSHSPFHFKLALAFSFLSFLTHFGVRRDLCGGAEA